MASIIVDATRLREDIERDAEFMPLFNTNIVTTVGGRETANQRWVYPRHQYDVSYGIQSAEDLKEVQEFFYARRGQLRGFLFKDWNDYAMDNIIAEGDGVEDQFQIFKVYADTVNPYNRRITHPVTGTVEVRVNSVLKVETTDYVINYTTGILDFGAGDIPALGEDIEVICEFNVPVRFANDNIATAVIWENAKSISNINLIEVRAN